MCRIINLHSYCIASYVTGFSKTNQNVTLGLFHFIGPANSYTFTHYTFTVALVGLADWFAFL